MKFTKSLPAKATASAKVPMSTTVFSTLTPRAWSSCMSTVKKAMLPPMISQVWPAIQPFTSGVMKVRSFAPLIMRK